MRGRVPINQSLLGILQYTNESCHDITGQYPDQKIAFSNVIVAKS